MFSERDGACFLSQRVGINQFMFTRRKADAPPRPKPDWTKETVNGKTAHRTRIPFPEPSSAVSEGFIEMLVFDEIPDYPHGTLMMNVHISEESPSPDRRATLTVGTSVWALNRVETKMSYSGASADVTSFYNAAGDIAEQILSAMTQPEEILVSAVLVESNIAPSGVGLPSQGTFATAPGSEPYFGPLAPDVGATRSTVSPSVSATNSHGTQQELPKPVLYFESRSTQLPHVIQSFRDCYDASAK